MMIASNFTDAGENFPGDMDNSNLLQDQTDGVSTDGRKPRDPEVESDGGSNLEKMKDSCARASESAERSLSPAVECSEEEEEEPTSGLRSQEGSEVREMDSLKKLLTQTDEHFPFGSSTSSLNYWKRFSEGCRSSSANEKTARLCSSNSESESGNSSFEGKDFCPATKFDFFRNFNLQPFDKDTTGIVKRYSTEYQSQNHSQTIATRHNTFQTAYKYSIHQSFMAKTQESKDDTGRPIAYSSTSWSKAMHRDETPDAGWSPKVGMEKQSYERRSLGKGQEFMEEQERQATDEEDIDTGEANEETVSADQQETVSYIKMMNNNRALYRNTLL